jgi:Mg2+ and Co2+ transporter CorA
VTGDAENALDFFIEAKQAEEQTALARRATEAQHRLNMVAALFLPITAVGSVLGLNLHNGFENVGPATFWVVCVVAFATGFVVRALVTRGERESAK